jgi:hypothetical protein
VPAIGSRPARFRAKARQLARIDIGDCTHCVRARDRDPAYCASCSRARQIADHEPGCIDAVRLDIFKIGACIADVRMRERDDWRQYDGSVRFPGSRDRGIEYDFTGRDAGSTD